MNQGPHHHDAAAAHEMLGHVEYLWSEDSEEEDENNLQSSFWDLYGRDKTIVRRRKGKSHAEKAAVHYQRALDILELNELDEEDGDDNSFIFEGSRGVLTASCTRLLQDFDPVEAKL